VPIHCYACPYHGEHDIFIRGLDVPPTHECPTCGTCVPHVISAPAVVNIKRDWDEQANLCRVNPYEQAKAQLVNFDREQQGRGKPPMKITEEAIQAGAKAIHEQRKT
jgi:hypothetical protein